MDKFKKYSQFLSSIAMFVLAISIFSLVFELSRYREVLPSVFTKLNQEKLASMISEVRQVSQVAPSLIEEVREVRKSLPSLEKISNDISVATLSFSKQAGQYRDIMPSMLKEWGETRKVFPSYMSKAQKMVSDLKTMSENQSQDMVTGFFKGIVTAPIKIVGGIGGSIGSLFVAENNDLVEEDKELLSEATKKILLSKNPGDVESFQNEKTDVKGKIVLQKIFKKKTKNCKRLLVWVTNKDKKELLNKTTDLCQKKNKNEWQVVSP